MTNAHIQRKEQENKNGKCSHSKKKHDSINIRMANAHIQRKEHNNRKIKMANAHIQRKNMITGT